MFTYPPVGFHFSVVFNLFPQLPDDFRFQEVSGLTVKVGTEPYAEGGENRFTHQLPARPGYNLLELKRGMFIGSEIVNWCINAIEYFDFTPTNAMVMLLNAENIPINSWYVVNAYPLEWDVAAFNAQKNEVAIETIRFQYSYFKTIRI